MGGAVMGERLLVIPGESEWALRHAQGCDDWP
jgi:hypothetical protein